jgi:DMSO/TMAO reductase YedYZ heme-binding membrane subunit
MWSNMGLITREPKRKPRVAVFELQREDTQVGQIAAVDAFATGVAPYSARGFSLVSADLPCVFTRLAMAATSNTWSVCGLGRWWKQLHRFGIHWLWFIFTFTYFGRLLDPESFERGIVQFILCLAALAVRLFAWRKRR